MRVMTNRLTATLSAMLLLMAVASMGGAPAYAAGLSGPVAASQCDGGDKDDGSGCDKGSTPSTMCDGGDKSDGSGCDKGSTPSTMCGGDKGDGGTSDDGSST